MQAAIPRRRAAALFAAGLSVFAVFGLTGCAATIPQTRGELIDTVGRDIGEMHRAHRNLAELYFDRTEADINAFIDEIWRPEFIKVFAAEFRLTDRVRELADQDLDALQLVMTRFIQVSTERIENERAQLLAPIQEQRRQLIGGIDAAYMQMQTAQSFLSGRPASVHNVRNAQNELLSAGSGGLHEKVALIAAKTSAGVAKFIETGRKIKAAGDNAAAVIKKISALKTRLLCNIKSRWAETNQETCDNGEN